MSGYTPKSTKTINRINGSKISRRNYVTQCKGCKFAIYSDDVTVWLTSPMGLSHVRCAP